MNDIKSLRLISWSTEGTSGWFPFFFKAELLFSMAWAKGSYCSPEAGFSRAEHPHTVGSLPALKQHRLFSLAVLNRFSEWTHVFYFFCTAQRGILNDLLSSKIKFDCHQLRSARRETALFCQKSSCQLCSSASLYNLIKCHKIMRITEISFYKN